MTFEELEEGDYFYFPAKGEKIYRKVEEQRRPYTPESHSNAYFDWKQINPKTKKLISEGRTFFYVSPGTAVRTMAMGPLPKAA